MPVIAIRILESTTMTGTLYETSRLIAHRVMFLVGKRAHRFVGYIDTIRIDLELRSRRTVLEIIFTVMLGHESSFRKRRQSRTIVIVHPETFPSVFFRAQHHDLLDLADRVEITAIQFHSLQSEVIT